MWKKRENILLILFAAVLFIIVVFIVVSFFEQTPQVPQNPTPTSTQEVSERALTPPPLYNAEKSQLLIKKLNNRKPLAASDTAAKKKLLSLLPTGQRSGTIYQTQNVRIEYVSAPDVFQGEILTINIEQSKSDAVSWLRSQGLSQDAICNYPVEFYLNYQVLNTLRGTTTKFNPLADGC